MFNAPDAFPYTPYYCIDTATELTVSFSNVVYMQFFLPFEDFSWDLKDYIERCFDFQILMDKEIKRITESNTPNYVHDLFRHLRGIREQECFISNYADFITKTATDYNKNLFRYLENKKTEDKSLQLIDTDKVHEYILNTKPLFSNFIKILDYYINRYNTGQIAYNSVAIVPVSITPQLPHETKQISYPNKTNEFIPPGRLKFNMTVEQLALLISLLKDAGLIAANYKDLASFLSHHIETEGTKTEKIKPSNLIRLFSTKNPDVVNYWIAKWKEIDKKLADR